MAKPVSCLVEMTTLLGNATATRYYNTTVKEYTTHLRKHIDAAKKAKTQINADCKFWTDILDRVDADSSLQLIQSIEKAIRN